MQRMLESSMNHRMQRSVGMSLGSRAVSGVCAAPEDAKKKIPPRRLHEEKRDGRVAKISRGPGYKEK